MKSTSNPRYERAIQAIKTGRAADSSWNKESRIQLRNTIADATNEEYNISFYNTKDNDCGIQIRKNGRFVKKDELANTVLYLKSQLNSYLPEESKIIEMPKKDGFMHSLRSEAAKSILPLVIIGAGIAIGLISFYSGRKVEEGASRTKLNASLEERTSYGNQLEQSSRSLKAAEEKLASAKNSLNERDALIVSYSKQLVQANSTVVSHSGEIAEANSTIASYSNQLAEAKIVINILDAKNHKLVGQYNILEKENSRVSEKYSKNLARLIEPEAKEAVITTKMPLATSSPDELATLREAYDSTKKENGGNDLSQLSTTLDIKLIPGKNFSPRQGLPRPDTYDSIQDRIRAKHAKKVQEKLVTHPSQSSAKTEYNLNALKGRNFFGDLDDARIAYVDEDSRFPSANFSDAGVNVLNALWSPFTALTFSQTESGREFRKDDGNFKEPVKKAGKGLFRIPANIIGSVYSLVDTVTLDKLLPNLSGYKDMNPAMGIVRQIGRVGASAQDFVDGTINIGGYPNNFYGPLVYGSGELIESAGHASQGIVNTAIALPLQALTKEDSRSRENAMIWADVIPTILDTSIHTVKLQGWEHSREGNTSNTRIKEGDVRFTLENLFPYFPIALSINKALESHGHGNGKVTGGDNGSPGTGGVIGGGDNGSPGTGF